MAMHSMSATTAMSASQFRAAMGMFATGVTIVTARSAAGEPIGLTVNSFNSVSLTPPLVLWSLGTKAASMAAFEQTPHYAIHVLAVDQKLLAERFASKLMHRFEGVDWQANAQGVPLLPGCAAVFECQAKSRYPEGDHVIFVGQVLHCSHDASRSPLLFHGGKFYTEHPL
ncbi:MAG: flavin reductase family protein [Brachymonas sp.]|nr:flavin reductase family protein [Brachymonas sp.]